MSSDISRSQSPEMEGRLTLLRAATAGQLDALPCPRCQEAAVSVWFTHAGEHEYRTWFLCAKCGFEMRAQNTGRPPHYSQERDKTAKPRRLLASE
jgi:hypothetical protein